MTSKKVFVSGCFDMLHSGHVAFFQAAATYGDLYVALGSDKTVYDLKGRLPVNTEQERLYMVQSVNGVKGAFVSRGSGMLDFEHELREMKPDLFVVNADGNIPQKEALCRELGIEYVVLERQPHADLPARSTTSLRRVDQMPYRIDVAGGWLDQPYVSQEYPGPVLTISLEPTIAFNERSGMATSTRNHALELWGPKLPPGDPQKLAYILFCYDNPPGTVHVSGSQDAIGIVMPGLNKADYEGKYWPTKIETVGDELALQFIERALYLVPLGPRHDGYNPLDERNITPAGAKALANAANGCWDAILRHDIRDFGRTFREAFEAQIAMFPHMVNVDVFEVIDRYKDQALGWKLSGAGGGGYVIFVAEQPIKNAVRVNIRRALD
ncbi:MAG: adenylyltransferase/cytidyltransferase family protein [Anaerolineae bacterium]